jgi:hypothetical protein
MYDLEAIERVSKKDIVWNRFVEVTRVLELQWDEYVFEYWNQLRRDPMYVKSMVIVGNSLKSVHVKDPNDVCFTLHVD